MSEKFKLVMIGDHLLSASGVGLQMRYLVEHFVKTQKFKIIYVGAALRHEDYRPQKIEEWGDDVTIIPCDGYGNPDLMRQILFFEKPDAILKMTDPRFYEWLYNMEHEIRKQCPILYNAIWDNYPIPQYNKPFYESVDFLGCINKLTYDIVCKMGFEHKAKYIPHGVPEKDFFIIYDKTPKQLKLQFFGEERADNFIVFYNSRNAMRKRTGNVIMAFKEFRDGLPEKERGKVLLAMHTPPKDREGQDLFRILKDFDLEGSVVFSQGRISPDVMREFYNAAEVTISMSSEEGFGLSVLESLMCGTPVICTRTGGMQDQVIEPETGRQYGFCVEPQARSLIGSQITPYIWSDHFDPSVSASKIKEIYEDWKSDKDGYKDRWAGEAARASMLKRFNLSDIQETWEKEIIRAIEEFRGRESTVEVQEI